METWWGEEAGAKGREREGGIGFDGRIKMASNLNSFRLTS